MARLVVVSNLLEAGNYFKQKWGGDVLQQHGKIWYKIYQKIAPHMMQNRFSYLSSNPNPRVPPREDPPREIPPRWGVSPGEMLRLCKGHEHLHDMGIKENRTLLSSQRGSE